MSPQILHIFWCPLGDQAANCQKVIVSVRKFFEILQNRIKLSPQQVISQYEAKCQVVRVLIQPASTDHPQI